MTKTQLIFSLGIGIALMATGFALATTGLSDWGLFWTGAIITSLTLASHLREGETSTPFQASGLLPATTSVDH